MRDVEGIGASTRECSMIQLSKMSYWLIIMVVVLFATNLIMLSVKANDASVSEGTRPLGNANEIDFASKVELQSKTPTSPNTMVGIDPVVAVEIKRLFNELERERLSNRSGYIDKWLAVVAIVFTFFAVVIAVLGIVGYRRFRELETDAKKHVEEIKANLAQSEEHLGQMNSIDFGDREKAPEIEKAIRDVQSDPDPSFTDKVVTEIYTLQHTGRVEDALEKWRSIANIAEGIDNVRAFQAWLSIAYLLPEGEERLAAYDRAMDLNPDYTRSARNQPISRHSKLFHDTIVVGAVLRYFNDPRFERFSIAQEEVTGPDRYEADVVLYDEEGQLVVIVECKVNERVAIPAMAQFKRYFRNSGTQFGLLAVGTDFSNWTFFQMLEGEFTEITRSQFEEGLVEFGSP